MVTGSSNDETTTLVSAGGEHQVVVAAAADPGAARRWLGAVRRIDRVIIEAVPGGHRALVRGRRHRLPYSSHIPLTVALGLVQLGVPAAIREPTT